MGDKKVQGISVEQLLFEARVRARQWLPGAFESSDEVSGIFVYAYGDALTDLACAVMRDQDSVIVGFYNAESLDCRSELLHPWGTRHRYVRLSDVSDLDRPALVETFRAVRARHSVGTQGSSS